MTASLRQKPNFKYGTWEALLDQPQRLELLLSVGKSYSRRFDDVQDCFKMLARLSPVHYLVDFDVLSDYISIDSSDSRPARDSVDDASYRRRFRIYSWFKCATRDFRVPWGAFQELTHYLYGIRSLNRTTRSRLIRDELNSEQTLRSIAKSLGMAGTEVFTKSELTQQIAGLLDASRLKLSRLNDFLSADSFTGVASDFDETIFKLLLEWISKCPRTDSTNRKTRDTRDAQNIAIAIGGAISRSKGDSGSVGVFVTSTSILLDLCRPTELIGDEEFLPIPEERRPDLRPSERQELITELCTEIGRRARGNQSVCRHFPIVHPRQATTAELIGFYSNPDLAMTQVGQQMKELREILDYCDQSLDLDSKIESQLSTRGIADARENTRRHVASLIQRFGARCLTDIPGDPKTISLHRLEDCRAKDISERRHIRYADEQVSIGSSADSIEAASTDLLWEFSRVQHHLAQLVVYDFSLTPVRSSPPVLSFIIRERVGLASDVEIMSGECYPCAHGECRLFVFRWPTYAFLGEFLDCLEQVALADFSVHGNPACFAEVGNDGIDWPCGIVLNAPPQLLGVQLAKEKALPRRPLREQFAQALRSTRVPRDLKGVSVCVIPDPTQVSVVQGGNEITFDCSVIDGEEHRFCTIMSSDPSVEVIGLLLERTGTRFVSSERIRTSLTDILRSADDVLTNIERDFTTNELMNWRADLG